MKASTLQVALQRIIYISAVPTGSGVFAGRSRLCVLMLVEPIERRFTMAGRSGIIAGENDVKAFSIM